MEHGWIRVLAIGALLASACTVRDRPSGAGEETRSRGVCIDRDDDGRGEGCGAGPDCDDHDPAVHQGCLRCATPSAGCACQPGARPVECYLDQTVDENGDTMCHAGTRYCRDGLWSGCESIHSYAPPERELTAIVDPDAGPLRCSDCAVNCFRISDNLDPIDGGLSDAGDGVDWAQGGGLTLQALDAGGGGGDAMIVYPPEIPDCQQGTGIDPDCDGIPDPFDPYPEDRPFTTTNPSIFLEVGPGQIGRGTLDLEFFINSADVYFLVDQSNSMAGERDRLKQDLTTGDFIQDPDFDCADYDFDLMPNNELKTQGIVGSIRCIIRDTNFGVGHFREIPFSPYVYSEQTNDHVAFWNYHDISGDVDSVLAAINRLQTVGNREWPEASMLALRSVLTGDGMYFGVNRRGIPPRVGCPEATWGYPCFREGAIPIVILFTDAQFHNGPDSNDYAYDNEDLRITAGTDERYYPLLNDNESFVYNPAQLGDLTSSFKTFTGDTTNMRADLPASVFSCLGNSDGNDAVFQFSITQQRTVTIESTGSQFDTVLGLYTGVPGSPDELPASDDTNEIGSNAYDFGDVYDRYFQMTGNTSGMAADYQWSDVSCDASGTSKDAVFKFRLSGDARVGIDASGSTFDTVLALYSAEPGLPIGYTAIANTNDNYDSAYSVGDVYSQIKAFSGSTASLVSNYTAGQIGCNADNDANDAVYSFSLSQPTRVRISSEGSSYDTVLALFNSTANPVGTASVPPTNEVQTSAFDAGILNGRIYSLTGSTGTMAADIGRTPIGCNSNDYAADAVFKFSLTEPADVQIDTSGTSFDGVLSLHNQAIDANTTYLNATNTNENYATATDLGVLNAREVRMLGASTGGMTNDFNTSEVSCSNSNSAKDAAYKFQLDTDTTVRIDLAGSSFNTTVSLHRDTPAETITALPSNNNEAEASAHDVGVINGTSFRLTGNTSGMSHDVYPTCNAHSSARDSAFKFTLSSATQVEIDTEGSSYDTVLGLYPETIVDPPVAISVGNSNTTRNNATNLGVMNGQWKEYLGTTVGAGRDHNDLQCGADSGADDSYFRFQVTGTSGSSRNISISLQTASLLGIFGYDGVLYLYRCSNSNASSCTTLVECAHSDWTDTDTITRNLTPAHYMIVVKGDRSDDEGEYKLTVRDTDRPSSNLITCDDNGGSGNLSRITANLSAGTYHVVVSGTSASASGPYTIRFRDRTFWNSFGEIECDDDDGPGSTSFIERFLTAGEYWFIVKGRSSSNSGSYQLRVTDVNPPPETIPAITCDDDSGGGNVARIVRNNLPAGDYWVVLKGDDDDDDGNYRLNIRDLSATASGAVLECDDDSGDAGSSVIERNLDPGTYQVIVKGDAPADEGNYKISFRDVTNRPYNRIACDNDSGSDDTSYIEQSLTAGEYYVVLKGNEPNSSGSYSLSVRDVTHRPLSSTFCDDNGSLQSARSGSLATPVSPHLTSRIVQTLNPGTYYIALKGKDANAKGPYQLSVGTGATHNAYYDPPTWSDTLAAIQTTGAHVIPILSCHDDPNYGNDDGDCNQTRDQAIDLANASDALGENLHPLVFDIDGDGSGLSRTVVNAIAELANYLEMDVKVVVHFEPDDNPGFIVTVNAHDMTGDGCSGLIGNEHQNCVPGASPRFTIDFENPLGAPVEPHPTDPSGGYHFRADLIGDDQFVIDSVPIYIIPDDILPDMGPPAPEYVMSGEYWQDVSSPGCDGNTAPDWHDLNWNADVYPNTTVRFSACTAQDPMHLATCTPKTIATITGAADCMTSDDCPIGYCDTDIGVCQVVRVGTCTDSSQCAHNAFCDTSVGQCTYTSQPVYIGGALVSDNFNSHLRMIIDLGAVEPFDHPPVVHSWDMTYYCNNVL